MGHMSRADKEKLNLFREIQAEWNKIKPIVIDLKIGCVDKEKEYDNDKREKG